jgi:transcriptional regulator with XRE-family HTH domain
MAALQIVPILQQAGLSKSDLSRLSGFSRVSINKWISEGREPRRPVDAAVVVGILRAIERGVEDGTFPLPPNLSIKERHDAIRNAIRARMDLEVIDRFLS